MTATPNPTPATTIRTDWITIQALGRLFVGLGGITDRPDGEHPYRPRWLHRDAFRELSGIANPSTHVDGAAQDDSVVRRQVTDVGSGKLLHHGIGRQPISTERPLLPLGS
jgi:hypothetical protein